MTKNIRLNTNYMANEQTFRYYNKKRMNFVYRYNQIIIIIQNLQQYHGRIDSANKQEGDAKPATTNCVRLHEFRTSISTHAHAIGMIESLRRRMEQLYVQKGGFHRTCRGAHSINWTNTYI